ncbi:hypothetical protein MVI27_10375 [Chryseobacterium salipaludis]|uniref:hypothetical protein n=1 Tax=Chryseobacterium TaxID=59732 RepID=UPI001FF14725|nr:MULTISPECIES: hypothetical protein [Chryseobacterium]MCJ8498666.1 hypothetical protein [Chryseobacterium salipaludis]MCX3297684.1 hypothetical protein [Planobacterium sp. JC490]
MAKQDADGNHNYSYGLVLFFLPFTMDHFGYHIPTIKWLSSAGLVRGLANLDMVLG